MNLTIPARAARVLAALAVCFWASVANATANVTSLMLESQTGDYVGQGERRFFWANDAAWTALQQPVGVVSFAVQPPSGFANGWYLYFASPNGAPLTVGTYSGVARYLSQAANQPGMDVFGEGRGCQSVTGSFTVWEAVYGAGSQIVSFRATFEQYCEGLTPALRGEIRYNASVPIEFASTSVVKGTFGQPLTVAVTANSLLGGNVTLSALGLPSGAAFTYFGNSAGAMTWTPSLADAGSHLVGFRGQNAQGVVDTVYIRVVITPANDDIENALTLPGIPNAAALEGSNIGATTQLGEFGSSQRSVWFRFTAPSSERLVLNTAGATFTSRLDVYNDITPETGPAFGDLVVVATGYPVEIGSYDSRLVLETTAGGVYYVSVNSRDGGQFTLQWRRAELTRLLWQHTTGAFAIWTVDGTGGVQFSPTFGPYPGWQAIRLGVGADRQTRLLWRHTTGLISVWTLNAAGQVVASPAYGPFDGWTASDMAIGSDGLIHLAWTHTTGALRLWQTPANADQIWSDVSYGPYAGWTPAGLALDDSLRRRILWRSGATVGLWSEPYPGSPIIDGVYGPFADWTPTNLTAGTPDQSIRLLWRHSGGAVGLWRVMPGGSVDMRVLGPYSGWQALAIAVPNTSPDFGDVYPRILWRHTTGMVALWKTSESVDTYKGLTFGPYAGWTAIDLAIGPE